VTTSTFAEVVFAATFYFGDRSRL